MAFRPIEKSIKQNKSASVLPTQDLNEGDLNTFGGGVFIKHSLVKKAIKLNDTGLEQVQNVILDEKLHL